MAKAKSVTFFCKECGYESAKWMGQCPGCREWNSFVEAPAAARAVPGRVTLEGPAALRASASEPQSLENIDSGEADRISTGFHELDIVLGGGLVPASLLLVGGDPGIGKSTLLLQICRNLAAKGHRVLYISGEESLRQIKLRAERIGVFSGPLQFLSETNLDIIAEVLRKHRPEVVIIDSIQTMYRDEVGSAPGSVGQVRESTSVLMQLAKGLGITIFIVGHVTKEGTVAGPRMLEHMVDTVLYFEGERNAVYRILRGVKNRFGSTNEIGVFEMNEHGLAEVPNPSEFMLSGRPEETSGSVVTCVLEGTRPVLLEVQALVCRTNFGMPRRTAAGTDYNRVNLLMAVLEKRLGMRLSECDAYLNIAGGMRISEPSLDLAIILALVSSYRDRPVSSRTLVFGEVGLSGEVRGVNMAEQRVNEAIKMGFDTCILPKSNLAALKAKGNIRLVGAASVQEAIQLLKE